MLPLIMLLGLLRQGLGGQPHSKTAGTSPDVEQPLPMALMVGGFTAAGAVSFLLLRAAPGAGMSRDASAHSLPLLAQPLLATSGGG